MNDEKLCEMFGTTLEEVGADVEKYEEGDFSEMTFGVPIGGGPVAKMKTASFTSRGSSSGMPSMWK